MRMTFAIVLLFSSAVFAQTTKPATQPSLEQLTQVCDVAHKAAIDRIHGSPEWKAAQQRVESATAAYNSSTGQERLAASAERRKAQQALLEMEARAEADPAFLSARDAYRAAARKVIEEAERTAAILKAGNKPMEFPVHIGSFGSFGATIIQILADGALVSVRTLGGDHFTLRVRGIDFTGFADGSEVTIRRVRITRTETYESVGGVERTVFVAEPMK